MHDGMEKGSLVISRKQHILICALAGLLLLGGVLGLSAHSDLQNAEKQFEDTISYVKEQCTGYDNLNLATEAKSLMRVMENAQHLCSEIARDQQENPGRVLDDAAMEEYLQDYTLSGILVLSAEGKILCGASQDGRVADPQVRTQMEKELAGSIVLKVADHPPAGLCRADGKGGQLLCGHRSLCPERWGRAARGVLPHHGRICAQLQSVLPELRTGL